MIAMVIKKPRYMKLFRALLPLLLSLVLAMPVQARMHGAAPAATKSTLMGLNVSALDTGGGAIPGTVNIDYIVPTAAEFDYYRSKNLNLIRIPFLWERVQPTLSAPLDTTYLGYIQTIAGYAQARGMKVLLDVHNYGSYCYAHGAQTTCGQINGVNGPTYAQYANLWSRLATAFVGNAGIAGYDLMNEPHDMPSSAVVPTMYQAAVTAIRLVDTVTPIYLEGDAYASAYGWLGDCANCGGAPVGGWATGGNNDLLTITDPNDHLVFSAHSYGDYNSSGTYPLYPDSVAISAGCTALQDSYQCAQVMGDNLTSPVSALNTSILTKRYTPFINWCNTNHITCHVGETGVPKDSQNWLTALDNGISLMQGSDLQFTYWNAGPFYQAYNLGVEPTNGVDTPQMAVLTKYTQAQQPTAFYISGPNRGTSGIASSAFAENYYGYIRTPFTITLSDSGAGGTFTPATLACSAGFNCSKAFTYTAPGTDVYALSATNTVQLTGNSVGFATIADQFSSNSIADANIINVYSTEKIYAPYVGPAVNLRRTSDGATQDFGFTSIHLNAPVDQSAITTWAAGSPVKVVTYYDQGPNANNATPPIHDTTPSTADQPTWTANCQNSLACSTWLTNRMEINSPVNGNTAQTILSVFAPTLHQESALLNWVFCCGQTENQAWSLDVYNSNNISNVRGYSQDGIWSVIGGTYSTNSSIGMNSYTNGTLLGQAVTGGTPNNFPFRNNANFGWQVFTGNTYAGTLGELVVLNSNLSSGAMAAFQTDQKTRWNIGNFPSYTWKTPTLAQSTTLVNAPPWAGVNQGGIGFGVNFDAIPVATVQSYYANRGMNITRFPVAWEMLQQGLCTGNTTLDATELAKLASTITNVTASGQDIIIDLHNFGSYNYTYNGRTCASPPDDGRWTSATTSTYFVNFWTQIAALYASNPKVKFDLMNEPAGSTAAASATVQQLAITAIRGQSFNGYIFTEFGPSFAACEDVSANAGPAFITLTDAQSKLVLECHAYTDSNNSGNSDYSAQGKGLSSVQSATTYALAHNIKLFLGETGVGFTPSNYSEEKVLFDYMAANMDSGSGGWVGFTAWGGGPYWPESYYYLFEPRATNYSPVVTPFVDRPMMRFLNTYATGNSWPSAGGAWPNNVQFP